MNKAYITVEYPADVRNGMQKYINRPLVEAEFIEIVFQLFYNEAQRIYFETKEELTFEKARQRLEENVFYKGRIRQWTEKI